MTGDLNDFYLGTILVTYEYIQIPIAMLSHHIIDHYNLTPLIHNGFVYAEKSVKECTVSHKLASSPTTS